MLHLDHESAMDSQMVTEVRLEHKEFLFKGVLCLHTVVVFYSFLPHHHEFPLLKLLEEAQFFDMVIRVTLNKPLTQRNEFNWHVHLVKGKTLAGKSVVGTSLPL